MKNFGALKKTGAVAIILVVLLIFIMNNNVSVIEDHGIDTLRICVIPNIRPYCYKNDSGTLTGFNVDAMTAVALELGISIEWVEAEDNNEIVSMMNRGKIDCALGVNIAGDDVGGGYLTSAPFVENKVSIFIKKHDPKIKSFEDLKFRKVSVYRDDPMIRDIDDIEGIRVFKTDTVEDAVALLINGMAEAYIGDKLISTEYIYNSEYKNNVKLIGDRDCNWITAVTAPIDSDRIINVIEGGMGIISKQQTMSKIRIKWFGQYIDENAANIRRFIAVITVAVMSVGLVFAIFYRINNLLRKQVRERTQIINEEKILKEEIINSLFDGVLFVDTSGSVILENTAAMNIMNENESMISKDIIDLRVSEYIKSGDMQHVITTRRKLIQQETASSEGHEEKYIQYNMAPVMRNESEMRGITISFRDITEEKKMMKKLISRDKMESLGRLTAGIAHEIRNPLTSIGMYVELLSEKIDVESFRRQIMEDIPREIDRLNNILISLLDYAKPAPSQREIFNVGADVDFIVRLLNSQIKKSKIRLNITIDQRINIYFDRQQFKQIMINLIINAADASRGRESPQISIRCCRNKECVLIEICDNGTGIPGDVKQHIFEPFFSTKSESYGLGLSIVEQLIKENDSEIYVSDNIPSGTCFGIRIPDVSI